MISYDEFAGIVLNEEGAAKKLLTQKDKVEELLNSVSERPLSIKEVFEVLGGHPDLFSYVINPLIEKMEGLSGAKGDFRLTSIGSDVYLCRRSVLAAARKTAEAKEKEFLMEEYGKANDNDLTEDAKELKRKILAGEETAGF